MQMTRGDQSPVIEAGGNVSVNYGLDEERVKAMLERQQEELFRKLRESNMVADEKERRLLEQQLQAVSAKLTDIEQSYKEELARRKAADTALARLRGQLPEAQLENAQASLRQGDKDAAKSVFHGVLDKEGASVALAAYQLGQMAESDLNYAEAMRMYKKAVVLEEDNPEYLLAAGKMARKLAEYKLAEEWLEYLLEIREAEGESAELGSVLHELALLRKNQGKYAEAEPLYLQAVAVKEKALGKDHPDVAEALNDLAVLYWCKENYGEAEPLYLCALAVKEQFFGKDHPCVAQTLNDFAILYRKQGRMEEAKSLHLRALEIREKNFGKEHLDIAESLNNLGFLHEKQENYLEAEKLYLRSLSIKEQLLGKEHPKIALSLTNLADLYRLQSRYNEAEPLLHCALQIRERKFGKDHSSLSITLRSLANLYRDQGRYEEAEPLFQRALIIMKEKLPAGHSRITGCQKEYDEMKQKMAEQQQSAAAHEEDHV